MRVRIIAACLLMAGNLSTANIRLVLSAERTNAEAPDTVFNEALEMLKELEGFAPVAVWDVNAYRNGHGTKAPRGERITKAEAAKRMRGEFKKYLERIETDFPGLPKRQSAALASMLYNLGSFGPGLKAAIRSGDEAETARWMSKYIKADGEPRDGLRNRRSKEIAFYLGAKC